MFPLKAKITQQKARVVIVSVWLLAIIFSMPFLFHRKYDVVRWKNYSELKCDDNWPGVSFWDPEINRCMTTYPSKIIYYTFFSMALFFMPISIMGVTYSLLVYRLWMTQLPGEKSDAAVLTQSRAKKKVVKMVLIVLLVFIMCWMPLQILNLYSMYGHTAHQQGELPEWFSDVEYVAYFIAYSNSAANPVIYCGFNANFRQGLVGIVRCSLVQDFTVRTQRGKSSTLTTHAGSGRLRELPTGITAATHELSEIIPPAVPPTIMVQRPDGCSVVLTNHHGTTGRRRKSSGDYEEVILGNPGHSTNETTFLHSSMI